MRTKLSKIIILFIFTVFFISCYNELTSYEVAYIISPTEVKYDKVINGDIAKKPQHPVREGYIF